MARRYVGDAVVTIKYVGTAPDGREEYAGTVWANGAYWKFDKLFAPRSGFGSGVAYDSAKAYDEMAASACAFASYFTSDNRGDDVPDWAPSADLADDLHEAIVPAMGADDGTLSVQRRKDGPVVLGAPYHAGLGGE